MYGTVEEAWNLGAKAVGATIYFGSDESNRQLIEVAQAFERLLKQIDIDWEEMLSRYTGDAIAYQVGNLVRGLKNWGQQSTNAFADDLRDYLQIEAQYLPLPDEVEAFNNAVDDLRAAAERLEMRVQRLQNRLASSQANTPQ